MAAFEQFDDLVGFPILFKKGEQSVQIAAFEQWRDGCYELLGLDGLSAHRIDLRLAKAGNSIKGTVAAGLEVAWWTFAGAGPEDNLGLIIIRTTDSDLRPVAFGFLLPFLLGLGLFDAVARGVKSAALAIGHTEMAGFIAGFGGARCASAQEHTEDD